MKWIELIRVRSTAAVLASALSRLQAQVQEIEDSTNHAETHFLQHALYDGDLAVVVIWHQDCAPRKTREGLLVAAALEKLGAIEHAVWFPATGGKP